MKKTNEILTDKELKPLLEKSLGWLPDTIHSYFYNTIYDTIYDELYMKMSYGKKNWLEKELPSKPQLVELINQRFATFNFRKISEQLATDLVSTFDECKKEYQEMNKMDSKHQELESAKALLLKTLTKDQIKTVSKELHTLGIV